MTTTFDFTEVLPLGPDSTEYRLVTTEGIQVVEAAGRRFLEVEPSTLTSLATEAIKDIQHLLRPSHLAQLRAIVDDLVQFGENPRVYLFYGGRTRDDLHELENLQRVAASNPWLTVVPVLENDPEIVGAEQGTLAEAVTRYGAWADWDVLISGSPGMIRATISSMLVAGTPLDQIKYDPFTLD